MKAAIRISALLLSLLAPLASAAQDAFRVDDTARRLAEAGSTNVRAAQTADFTVFTVENDYYKIPAEGFSVAARILEEAGLPADRPVKLIGTAYKIPEVTMTLDPATGVWHTTKRLDASWDAVRREPKRNNSFGLMDIKVYPQVSLKNLIITQVYQSLWQLSPALEVSLWPGGSFSYQVKIPIINDGYGSDESLAHPGFVTVSQRFRDPWQLNIFGKLTAGVFNASYIGAALELAYWLPNERFWVDSKLGLLDLVRFGPSMEMVDGVRVKGPFPEWLEGFWMHTNATPDWRFCWNIAVNYYNPALQTQFLLRYERFVRRDRGVKFEMIRHFEHCSIGFYLMKGPDPAQHTNGGFRFQIALPPYHARRYGRMPRLTTSGQMGMSYNANNERFYYKEFRSEAADNIMSKNYYNPFFINDRL